MDIERTVLEILLRRVYFEDVSVETACGENDYKGLNKRYFLQEAKNYLTSNTEDENEQLYYWLKKELSRDTGLYGYILKIAERFVTFQKEGFYYNESNWIKESQFFHWKELITKLGQDIFLMVLLASKKGINEKKLGEYLCFPFAKVEPEKMKQFSWGDSNKGWAENHFHLKGSFPVFLLNWVCIMNHIGNRNDFFHGFNQYREAEILGEALTCRRKNIYQCGIVAASYRLHLYEIYSGVPKNMQMEFSYEKDFDETKLCILQDKIDYYLSKIKRMWGEKEERWIYCPDYALEECWEACYEKDEVAISGERYFLYRCCRAIFRDNPHFQDRDKNLFYKYLLLSFRIRSEFVQANTMRGFENFAIYQNRKEDIIDHYPEYQEYVIRLTGCSLRKWQNIASLEMRISPKETAQETLERIWEYTNKIEHYASKGEKGDYFYVLHFPKEKDEKIKELKPRNYLLRDRMLYQIESQKQLIRLEKSIFKYKGRQPQVRGYDTCAGEIGCRPEVFAQFYRSIQAFLRDNQIDWIHWTYHVGEDFLDLLDGLRAIDEAVQFCELPAGSRLGHGMALGIDVKKYYKMKQHKILLPRQELLDNISWVMGFCKDHGIVIREMVMNELEEKFEELVDVIYGRNKVITINSYETDIARQEVAVTSLCEEEKKEKLWILYYNAWKLRGDSPRMYMDYEIPRYSLTFEEELRKGLDNIRNTEECRNFYRYYHFSKAARINGEVPETFVISDDFIKLIRKIQVELREILSRKQIGIECNPTSNYKIGPFSQYDEHPIFKMYGKNLNDVPSSRMCVSLNTDDMGIFQTSLEMEYITMYVALLKCKDENGNTKYNKEEIEKWLEDVKEFGHVQSFKMEK